MRVREQVLKALEEARQQKLIGAPLEAAVTLSAGAGMFDLLRRHEPDLKPLFIVSAVRLQPSGSGNGGGDLRVEVTKAPGQKCERCWNYSEHVGEDPQYPTVCDRCSRALTEFEGGAAASNV
jgi:isoleucyl-tRNA synthetase